MAKAGAVTVPLIGAVPGWVVGFDAGWSGGTLICAMAHRSLVVESLKQILANSQPKSLSDHEAFAALKYELGRLQFSNQLDEAIPAEIMSNMRETNAS